MTTTIEPGMDGSMEGKSMLTTSSSLPTPSAPSLPAVPARPLMMSTSPFESFQRYCDANEISKRDCLNLWNDLKDVRIGLLIDDSPSMASQIIPEGTNAFTAPPNVTRWSEATNDALLILRIVLALKPTEGIDLYFLNRDGPSGMVSTIPQIAGYFSAPPSTGSTPLLSAFTKIARSRQVTSVSKYLLIIVTDGSPNDGVPVTESIPQFKDLLMRKPGNLYVSMVECSDCAEEMDYLESWNNVIPNFDNSEDYPEELRRVRMIQNNQNFKFSRIDYIIKILLAPLNRLYFSLDMQQQQQPASVTYPSGSSSVPSMSASATGVGASYYSSPAYSYPPPDNLSSSSSSPSSSNNNNNNNDCCCVIL